MFVSKKKKLRENVDDAFFNRIGLERVGVVGPEPGLLWIGLKALDRRAGSGLLLGRFTGSVCGSSLQKEQERRRADRGFVRGRSDA